MGRASRSSSQPSIARFAAPRSEAAVSEKLGTYALFIFSRPRISSESSSSSPAHQSSSSTALSSSSRPQGVSAASSAPVSKSSDCRAAQSPGRAWDCSLACSSSTSDSSRRSSVPAPTVSASRMKPGSASA